MENIKYKGLKIRKPRLHGGNKKNIVLIIGALEEHYIKDVILRDGTTGTPLGI
jgi:hypothetical protein